MASTVVYENPWIRVVHRDMLTPSATAGVYGVVQFANRALCVVPIDEDLCTYLVGQYRPATECYSWEFPEGGGPLAEDPLEGARRELLEETGLGANRWEGLGCAHLSNSVTDEVAHVFLARELFAGDASPEETEELAVRRLPFEEVLAMIDRGEIVDALTILGALLAERRLRREIL